MGDDYSLPKQLQIWRKHKRMTQAELEKKSGLGHNTVSRIERGESHPRTVTVEQLATALGISLQQLLYGRPRKDEKTSYKQDPRQKVLECIQDFSEDECKALYPLLHELCRFVRGQK